MLTNNQSSDSSLREDLIDAYKYAQEMADNDSIDFGDGINRDDVVESVNESRQEAQAAVEEKPNIDLTKTLHRQESTQLVTSVDQLETELFEELAKEGNAVHSHSGLILLICILLGVVGILSFSIYLFSGKGDPDPNPASQAGSDDPDHRKLNYTPLETAETPINIMPPHVRVLVNGVFINPADRPTAIDTFPLVVGQDNTVAVYAKERVPYSTRIKKDNDFNENPVSIELLSDVFYQKSNVTLKAPANTEPSRMEVLVNGEPILPAAEMGIECLTGFPYYVEVRAAGQGPHLHVFWPTKIEETLQLPALETVGNAEVATVFTLKLPNSYTQDKTLFVKVEAEGQVYNTPGILRIRKGELIDINVTKGGRYPLDMILNSTPFGSITVDGYLQPASRGAVQIRYSDKSEKDVRLCFRRASETVCANEDDTYVSSGKWEVIAYRELPDGTRQKLKEQPYETLQADNVYTVTIKAKGDSYSYKMALSPLN